MRPDHACDVFAVRRGEEVSILERRMTMERRIRGELTLREALQELDKDDVKIVQTGMHEFEQQIECQACQETVTVN